MSPYAIDVVIESKYMQNSTHCRMGLKTKWYINCTADCISNYQKFWKQQGIIFRHYLNRENLFYCRLFAGLCALLIGGIIQMFVQSSALELFIGIAGALLFSIFIIFDTQMLMHTLSPEEYILATINIYLDIINLFLHILRALAAARQ